MRLAARTVYAVLGALGVLLGVVALLDPSRALPLGEASPVAAHLVREQGADSVFIGLMAFWCLGHFESRRSVHYALLVFAALFSAVHWLEYAQGRRGIASPLVNSIPLAALLATAPLRRGKRAEPDERRTYA